MDNAGHVENLCSRLDIGRPSGELSRVYGGFNHQMWRLETDRGSYAVKQLSPYTDLGNADTVNHYNVTEAVAEAFAGHGISAIFAHKWQSNYLQVIQDVGYLVYPWCNATALGKSEISEQHAIAIAHVLARMHRANINVPALKADNFDIHPEEKIIFLVERAGDCHAHNATALKAQLPTLLGIVDSHKSAVQILQKHMVISHGDLDQKNVLWSTAYSPVLIDWEAARKLNPTCEIVNEALDWSGITSQFEHGLFEKIIAAYREAGGVIESDSLQASFHCILGDWVNWLMYNVGRSIDPQDVEQRTIGVEQVELALATILRLQKLMPALMSEGWGRAGAIG
jgi:thiamine kinase-like enzyme